MMDAATLAALVDRHRGHGHAGPRTRKVRVVVRLDRPTVNRLDTLRAAFPQASRASLIRAFVAAGVQLAEEHVKVTQAAP
jgi:hypothetical protein